MKILQACVYKSVFKISCSHKCCQIQLTLGLSFSALNLKMENENECT